MATTNFNTATNTYRKLIGNGLVYRIPAFQRDYSWGEEEWEDLWADLTATISGEEPAHYMGYLVLQSDDEKTFDVIDGQQRLTTLAILALAVLRHLQRLVDAGDSPEQNRQRIDELRRTYVGSIDPVTLATKSKLILNRNNDDFFQRYLVPLLPAPLRGLSVSKRALRKAFEYFERKVGDWLSNQVGDSGSLLAQFVSDMSDKLFFTVINVTDELNAYRVFETLNARGVKLSSTDLLKNYLFSVLHRDRQRRDEELPLLEQRWEDLVGRLGSEHFPEFLRVHWLSRGRFVRHANLFKEVRQDVTTRADVFDLLIRLDQDLDRYTALRDPSSSVLAPKAREYARQLKLFGVKQSYPLLLAAHRTFSQGDFETLFRACVVISFRYNVICGFSPGDQEPVFAETARAIAEGRVENAAQAIASLSRIYPADEVFAASFAEKIFPKGKEKIVRYILCELEEQNGQTPIDPEDDSLSIEHVLPQSPGAGWESFDDGALDSMTFRLANMVLVTKKENVALGNKPWLEKRTVLESSAYGLTRSLAAENADWNPDRLAARQNQLAKIAKARWQLSQLNG